MATELPPRSPYLARRTLPIPFVRYRSRMARWVRGFDDNLNRVLEEFARESGDTVERYVSRAVAAQMMADLRSRGADVDGLAAQLNANGVDASAMPDVSAAVTDPDRLRAVYATGLLDSPPEAMYDRITRAAADALDAPFSLISVIDVDRLYLKSEIGVVGHAVAEKQAPLERSLCQYAVASGTPLVLRDARLDPTFMNHPVVRDGSVVAYLGIPLVGDDGNAVGALCVYDTKPRMWGNGHLQILGDLAKLAAERIFAPESAHPVEVSPRRDG